MSELSTAWFEEAKRLEFDQSLMVQVLDKKEQKAFVKEMEEERRAYSFADPVHASEFVVFGTRRDGRFWVVVSRKQRAPLRGLVRNPDGSYEEVQIDPQRRRMLSLMVKDELPRAEIEEILGVLTEEEERIFFG